MCSKLIYKVRILVRPWPDLPGWFPQPCKLDLSQAYLKLPVDEESKQFLTIDTHQGLYVYNRLPFGVASASAIFQKLMDIVLQGVPGVTCYIDDILVSSADEDSHLQSLEEVFNCLEKHRFRLKLEKCEFLRVQNIWGML